MPFGGLFSPSAGAPFVLPVVTRELLFIVAARVLLVWLIRHWR